jgi:putative chitinase
LRERLPRGAPLGKVDLDRRLRQHIAGRKGRFAMINARRAQERLAAAGFAIGVDGDFGAKSFAALMRYVGKRSATEDALRTALGKAAAKYFPGAGLTTPLRIAHALAQQCVETRQFGTLVESLDYSQDGLRKTFKPHRISDADCMRLGRKTGDPPLSPERQAEIANIVYGGEFGRTDLGNVKPGDGWRFRGRGAKQTTGRSNYERVKTLTGYDVINNPALLEDPDKGMRAACIFWTDKGCNSFADADNIDGLTQRINGGTNGLPDRKTALTRAKAILL